MRKIVEIEKTDKSGQLERMQLSSGGIKLVNEHGITIAEDQGKIDSESILGYIQSHKPKYAIMKFNRTWMIDPPEGWRFGFPKIVSELPEDFYSWAIKNKYPEDVANAYGKHFHCTVSVFDDLPQGTIKFRTVSSDLVELAIAAAKAVKPEVTKAELYEKLAELF